MRNSIIKRSMCPIITIQQSYLTEIKVYVGGHVLRSPRECGRPKTRYGDEIRTLCGDRMFQAERLAQDRTQQMSLVKGVMMNWKLTHPQ